VVVLALVLATLAVAGLFLYTKSVKDNALTSGGVTQVVVSKVDIQANTDLNALIDAGQFELKNIPTDDAVRGAITEISDLRNRRNSVPIVAGEQIPVSRVLGGKVAGGILGIPDGYQALTIALDAPAAVTGAFAAGDNLTVYATFDNVPVTALPKNQAALFAKTLGPSQAGTEAGGSRKAQLAGQTTTATAVLVPAAEVLRVSVPQTQGGTLSTEQSAGGPITIALALTPENAQKFVFAFEEGQVYLSLLPSTGKGEALPPMTVVGILASAKEK
jgi:Flp pilus assembly protein CpaB